MQIGWIDFSPEERERTLMVLHNLQEPGSVDELGIGVVRDAFANRLFPGTSTLFTKARYFFLTAYLMKGLETGNDSKRRDPRSLRSEYNNLEEQCARGLLSRLENHEGIIGRVTLTQGKWVSRGPGEIYWASLHALGFLKPFSPTSYTHYFAYASDARMRYRESLSESTDDGANDDNVAVGSVWNIPPTCWHAWEEQWRNWRDSASIALTDQEADFLKTQIIKEQPKSLFALLMQDETLRTIALASQQIDENDYFGGGESSFHSFFHHAGFDRLEERSPKLAALCLLADCFSEFVLGCRIAYNMQLTGLEWAGADAWEQFSPRASEVAHKLSIDETIIELNLTHHAGFLPLRDFLQKAQQAMLDSDIDKLKRVVRERERDIKRKQQVKIGRDDLGEIGWRGGLRLPYRYNQGLAISREIDQAGGFNA